MAKVLMLMRTVPLPGREDEYNDWYENIHLPQVLEVDGFVAAQRFRLLADQADDGRAPYLAVYELDTEDVAAARAALASAAEGRLTPTVAMDRSRTEALFFEAIGADHSATERDPMGHRG